jgi:DNA adenine methylase
MMVIMKTLKQQGFSTSAARPAITSETKPFLKWVGGKSQLIHELKKYAPVQYGSYHEPFLGGGAFFFRGIPDAKTAYLHDLNAKLIAAYIDIRDHLPEVQKQLDKLTRRFITFKNEPDKKAFYLKVRTKYNKLDLTTPEASRERTALLIFLNKTCFNGVYRENSRGEFNVPYGQPTLSKIVDSDNLIRVSEKLKGKHIFVGPYTDVLARAEAKDFIYLDPPYVPVSKTADFTSYHSTGFTMEDHRQVAELFEELDRRGCYVMLSNSYTDIVQALYGKFWKYTVEVNANRNINCKGNLRKAVKEVLIKNY